MSLGRCVVFVKYNHKHSPGFVVFVGSGLEGFREARIVTDEKTIACNS